VIVLAQIAALVAILGVGVVYGTDTFCALVQRPALARVADAALTTVMGNMHRYGDKRMPVPGVVGLVGSASTAVLAAVSGDTDAAVTAGIAVVLLVIWLVLYTRISAPINRTLTAAADRGETPVNARALQAGWDRIIGLRATLQGLALLAAAVTLILL
jgi:MFS-type transporter involved in bile tolerance (Atg22 family)